MKEKKSGFLENKCYFIRKIANIFEFMSIRNSQFIKVVNKILKSSAEHCNKKCRTNY